MEFLTRQTEGLTEEVRLRKDLKEVRESEPNVCLGKELSRQREQPVRKCDRALTTCQVLF